MTDAARCLAEQARARDMKRGCQICGRDAYCTIVRTLKPGRYTMVEDARAVCPACLSGDDAAEGAA